MFRVGRVDCEAMLNTPDDREDLMFRIGKVDSEHMLRRLDEREGEVMTPANGLEVSVKSWRPRLAGARICCKPASSVFIVLY